MRRLILLFLLSASASGDLDALVRAEAHLEAAQHRLTEIAQAVLRRADAAAMFAPGCGTDIFAPVDAVDRGWWTERETRVRGHRVGSPAERLYAWLDEERIRSIQIKPVRLVRAEAKRVEAIVAFDARGPGVWVSGRALVCLVADQICEFRVQRGRVRHARTRLLIERAAAAGLAATDPPSLDHPTLGLAAYGAAAGDADNDGRIDLVVARHDGNRLHRNRGDGTFATVALPGPPATAPLFLDFDNDGDSDLFFSRNGSQVLLENRLVPDGTLAFRDVSTARGVAVETIGFTATAGDVNGDGRPDIYVAAYNNYGPVAPASWDDARNGLPNLLFVSRPDGTYREQAKAWGADDRRWSYAAQFVDIDEDGKLDLYVANDFGAGNAMLRNRGGTFEDVAKAWGIRDDGYAMGVHFGDYDNDGAIDLHVTRMSSVAGARILDALPSGFAAQSRLRHLSLGNGLYRRVAKDRFEDVTTQAGPFPAGWAWGGGFWDLDNDSNEDLFVPNGHMSGATLRDT